MLSELIFQTLFCYMLDLKPVQVCYRKLCWAWFWLLFLYPKIGDPSRLKTVLIWTYMNDIVV